MKLRNRGVTMAVIAVLVLSGCGGAASTPDSGSDGSGTTRLSLGIIPLATVAPIYMGIEQGFFEEEGLELEPHFAQDGASIVTSVLHGDRQIGFAATIPLITARAQDVKVRMVAGSTLIGEDPEEDSSRIWVPADSPITSPADLEGKRVAVNALRALFQYVAENVIAADGGDPKKVRFVALPFPNILPALEAGDVDAIMTTDQFTVAAESADLREISRPYSEAMPGATVSGYFASDAYIEANPDIIERFHRALDRAFQYANEHPDEVKAIVPTYTDLTPEVLDEMPLEPFEAAINRDSVETAADRMVELGYIPDSPSMDELLYSP